jgi:hypothetical protein
VLADVKVTAPAGREKEGTMKFMTKSALALVPGLVLAGLGEDLISGSQSNNL